ncbi:nSTAND1 domain-containing NTPase [Streptomyces sp. SP17KL33]|uniref:nSTAND1 domain-containing NTPase n=1 Tax=Streptomyces sp. SP17KL33 TaxID=3002534 RepID=UPI002E770C2E|nr:helix-turn-helix domain-containing protein [Streptomyces sp. SP17KL33]MEE1829485.1 helix-turn-helix domain-containing protein [Streptomyces sp. SP17KL33]
MDENTAGDSFGAALRRLRTARGLSLSQLAAATRYSKSHLSNVENDRKRAHRDLAGRLDDVLGAGGELTRLCETAAASLEHAVSSPFQGLAAFDERHACWFFGRDRATATLVEQVVRARRDGGPVIVIGASGAGKSSLLRAGLLPRVADGTLEPQGGGGPWRSLVVTPGADPAESLARALATVVPQGRTELADGVRTGRLPGDCEAGMRRLLLVVDQLEEVFTLCRDTAERAAFLDVLCAVPLAVLAVRADFTASCLTHPGLVRALQSRPVALGAMSRDELAETIRRPARLAGLELEDGLADVLLQDLDPGARGYEPGALPLLSHALLATWQQRAGKRLTLAGYHRTGGIRGAVATTAERTYRDLPPDDRSAARRLMLRLVHVGEEGSDSRRRAERQLLGNDEERALEAFTRARLLTIDDTTVEIAHEALLRAWPRLAGWIDADRDGIRVHQRLTEAAHTWEQTGRAPSLLLQGATLAVTLQWTADTPEALSAPEQAFLNASAQVAKRGVRRLRQLSAALATMTVLAVLAAVLAGLGLSRAQQETTKARSGQAAAVAGRLLDTDPARASALAVAARRQAPGSQAAKEAVAAAAGVPVPRRLEGAGGKRLSAIAMSRSVPGRPALLATGTEDGVLTLRKAYADGGLPAMRPAWHRRLGQGETTFVSGLAFSHDGGTLMAAANDQVWLWRLVDRPTPHLSDGRVLWQGSGEGHGSVDDLRLSADGTALAAAATHQAGGQVLLWDCDAHGPRRGSLHSVRLPNPTPQDEVLPKDAQKYGNPYAVSFSADGRLLSAAGSHSSSTRRMRGIAAVWRRPAGGRVADFSPHGTLRLKATATEAPLAADGTRLAVAVGDGSLRICPVAGMQQPFVCKESVDAPRLGEYVAGMAYSPDDTLLAEADHNGPVRLRHRLTGRLLLTLPHPGSVISLAFSPRGDILLAGAARGDEISVWRLPLNTLLGHTEPVVTSAMPACGAWLATADRHTVRLSAPAGGTTRATVELHPADHLPTTGEVTALAADRDGTRLAVATSDNVVLLYDTSDPVRPDYLGTAGRFSTLRPVYSVALSPDGDRLAFGNDEKDVQLWSVPLSQGEARPAPSTRFSLGAGNHSHVLSVAFSPDGARVVGGTKHGALAAWNARPTLRRSAASGGGWDTRALQVLPAHSDAITALAFLGTHGSRLATGDRQGTVRLWHRDDSAPRPLSPAGDSVVLHTGAVTALTATAQGSQVASSSADGSAAIWNDSDQTPRIRYRLQAPDEALTSARLTPNGRWLWTTGTAVRRWPTSYDAAEAALCRVLGKAGVHSGDARLLPLAGKGSVCG